MEYPKNAFSRLDESDDGAFYATDRFVQHLDSGALATIEGLIGSLVVEENPVILDLMASWDSHLPDSLERGRVVGLGLNENELQQNGSLDFHVLYDLNEDPILPFNNRVFDAVICTVSVDYMTKPHEVFRDVARILKPGGLFLVIFSNRFFPEKVTRIWRESSEEERVFMVEDFFKSTGLFDAPQVYISRGKPRPADDKYAHLNIPSDPVYAVYANRSGVTAPLRKTPDELYVKEEAMKQGVDERKQEVGKTLCCPHCGDELKKWEVPQHCFTEWPNEYMYICFNDECPYFVRGWDSMAKQMNPGSYRLMYDPLTDTCQPVPVYNRNTLRDGIMQE